MTFIWPSSTFKYQLFVASRRAVTVECSGLNLFDYFLYCRHYRNYWAIVIWIIIGAFLVYWRDFSFLPVIGKKMPFTINKLQMVILMFEQDLTGALLERQTLRYFETMRLISQNNHITPNIAEKGYVNFTLWT